jgi:hypothetical protein
MSTEGPSGPSDAPLPSVMAAASALRTGAAAPPSRACGTLWIYVGSCVHNLTGRGAERMAASSTHSTCGTAPSSCDCSK